MYALRGGGQPRLPPDVSMFLAQGELFPGVSTLTTGVATTVRRPGTLRTEAYTQPGTPNGVEGRSDEGATDRGGS